MESGTPLTFPRVTGLIAGLYLRRFGNRFTAGFRFRKKPGTRAGTGRKRVGNPLGLMAIVAVFVFNYVKISSDAMRTLASEMGPPRDAMGRVEVQLFTLRSLEAYQNAARRSRPLGIPRDAASDQRNLERILSRESETANLNSRQEYGRQLTEWYHEKGLKGFAAVPDRDSQWAPRLLAWDDPALRPLLIHSLGLVLLILAGARHCWMLGSRNQDLGRVEWSTEWLFTLPASSRALFGAQILGHAFVDPFSWIGTIPLLLMMYVSSGASWPVAVPAALANSLYLGMVMAAVRIVSETWLRKHLAPARLKNLQALFTLMGIVLLFMLFALARSQEVAQWVLRVASSGSALLVWNPFSLPAAAMVKPFWFTAAWEAVCAVVIVPGSIYLCAWLVRDGLVGAPAVYSGSRGAGARSDYLPAGIIGKDLRLLLRDRNFFVQTLVAPALIVCFQVFFNVNMAQSITSNFQHAATFAFAVGAYVLISTGLSVLAVEGNSLWMLYGLPVALPTIMLRKTLLWAALGVFYSIVVLAVCEWHIRRFQTIDLSYALVAVTGVIVYSFIASGIGMLATDPLEVEVKRRIRPGMIYLYMILATFYGYALYAQSLWARLGQIVLSALLAYALWQKVRDRAPFLLDAVAMPPPRVSLADGLMAALGFFVLQGALGLFFLHLHTPFGRTVVLSFSLAGALVVAFTLLTFWRVRAVGVLEAIGLKGPRDGRRGRAVAIGGALGLAGAAMAFGYVRVLGQYPVLFQHSRTASGELAHLHGGLLLILGVVAAPLFEEFIFRGLVFRGLRRSLPARWSVVGSAAVFAICHPPASVIPVFVMGVLAALGFEWTGWLVTPICLHMVYNGLVLLSGLFHRAPL